MLNQQQQTAVTATTGPLRIIAGAGTGKTFTLIRRIAYLIEEKNIPAQQILALTFTNKAAHELIERLQKMGHPAVRAMTFHALAARFLRKFWNPDFIIVKDKEEYSHPEYPHPEGAQSIVRLQGEGIQDVCHILDFDDLLTTLLELWNEKPDILQKCQQQFQYILIDEYQDVNENQIEIMRQLAEPHQNLCVVGDPDQTIYSWRGARAETMMEFEKLYPETTSITLTQNYRNPPNILMSAEQLIKHNPDRLEKHLKATLHRSDSDWYRVALWKSTHENEKYEMMFHILEQQLGSHSDMHMADQLDVNREEEFRSLSDIALLYRTQGEGKKLASQLAKRGYPYQMSAPESFWERKEIIDFLTEITKLTNIDNLPDQKLSDWLREHLQNFINSQKLSTAKINRLNHLINYAMAFDHLDLPEALIQFLDETCLEQEADNLLEADRINLLTLHAAKGLEFPVVMIFGLEEGHIPHSKLKDDPYWLAEERRLLYVGMTRATEQLHLFSNQKANGKPLKNSSFLAEIGSENLTPAQLPDDRARQMKKREIRKSQMKLF